MLGFTLFPAGISAGDDNDSSITAPENPPKNQGCGCFRGKPLPECCSFWITEVSLKYRISRSWIKSDNPDEEQAKTVLSADLGFMQNITPEYALGFSVYGGVDADKSRLGIRGRYRRWLTRRTTLDISPGVLLFGGESGQFAIRSKYPGFVGSISIGYNDWISGGLHYEIIRFGPALDWLTQNNGSKAQRTLYGSLALSSYGGTAGMIVVGGLIALIAATW